MSTAAAGQAGQPGLSEIQRITKIFYEPSRTFADLRRSAAVWGPLVLMAILGIAFTYTIEQKVGFEQVAENMMRNSPRAEQMEKLPAEQREAQLRGMATGMKYFSYGGIVVFAIMMLIISAVLMGTFNFGMGAEIGFKQAFAIVIYSALPVGVMKNLLAQVSLLAGADPAAFNLQNPVATNPGYFMNPADSPFLFALMTQVDVLLIWTLALTAIGFSVLTKVKTGTAAMVVFGWWAVFALLMSSFALMGG